MNDVYINEEEALKRLGGNKTLYIKLLKRFAEDQSYIKLVDTVAAGDLEEAERLAHTIKGMAANLSLTAAYQEATNTDNMLKGGSADPGVVQVFKEAMVNTIAAIAAYCG